MRFGGLRLLVYYKLAPLGRGELAEELEAALPSGSARWIRGIVPGAGHYPSATESYTLVSVTNPTSH